jgi:non-heme chloroperoxidase
MTDVRADDGVKIAYTTKGTGARKVVFVHGWMVSSRVYTDLLERLDAEGRTFLVPDLRGSGASDRPGSGYTLERHMADVVAAADHAGAERFIVVGHSMGGQLAQLIAATHPGRVDGVLLLTPVPASGLPIPEDAAGLFRSSGGNRDAQRTILNLATKQLDDAAKERLLDDAGAVAPQAVKEGFDAWSRGGFEGKLAASTAPTLVLATDDPFLPPALLREKVCGPIQGARLAHLPGPGHYPQVERPAETAAIVDAFLAGVR